MTPKLELGFMRHGKDVNESQKIVDFAINNGQPYFETCYFYFKDCEQYIYSLLSKYNRNSYEICGKMPVKGLMENKGCETIFQEQIARAPGHYFDTYILQALDNECLYILSQDDAISYLLKEKEKGNIGKFGLSIQCTPETFKKYLKLNCWDIVQMQFNYYDWFLCRGNELYTLAKEHNLPIIAQSPLKGGLLSKIKDAPYDSTQFALDFIKNLEPEYILTGASQYNDYVKTWNDIYINNSKKIELEKYKEIIFNYFKNTKINCNYCNQCVKACPRDLPISGLFYLYNNLANDYTVKEFNNFNAMKKSILNVYNCGKCQVQCNQACPKHIQITDMLHNQIFDLRV